MQTDRPISISTFFVAGINYKKADADTRGLFAINNDQYGNILNSAPAVGLNSLFVISTCNRTEIYGFAQHSSQLINLLCAQTKGTAAKFMELAYIKSGSDAIEHLFNVGAGLDSQILGDYEIVGQLKNAVKFSKERNFINCFLERLVNSVLQASKCVKNDTALSGGTVSVAFAAVQYIKEHFAFAESTKIILIGTGKIGRNTCKNLVDYLGTTNITLINRTEERAVKLAAELNLKYAPIAELEAQIKSADIILAATNAVEPTILKSHLENSGNKMIIDLSIPYNVEASCSDLPNITLVDVDMLSKLKDEALNKRQAEMPKAKEIISYHINNFMEWHQMRRNAPVLQAAKAMLNKIATLHERELNNPLTRCPYIAAEQKIQQVMKGMVGKMGNHNNQGCYYIEAINEYMAVELISTTNPDNNLSY